MANRKQVQSPTPSATDLHAISLASKVTDRVIELSGMCKAFAALERLVSPEYADEQHAHVPASREELGELLHSLNADLRRRVDALADDMALWQAHAADASRARRAV